MKKFLGLVLVLLLALVVFGCAKAPQPLPTDPVLEQQEQEEQETNREQEEQREEEEGEKVAQVGETGFKPSLAGIKLGDPLELVLEILGNEYTESVVNEPYPFGEAFITMEYENGIKLIVGKDSKLVFEMETTSQDTPTNFGVKVGDKAEDALAKLRAFYEEAVSNHSDDTLVGWFLLEDLDLIILNFEKDDILVNDPIVKPGALVERIKLSNFFYMD
ncbi:MAG: hypothetical protein WAO24_00830 [Peptococcia bacterium]